MLADQYSITFDSYVKFIKDKSIIDGAIIFFVGGMIKDFVTKVMKEVIIPLTKGKIDVPYSGRGGGGQSNYIGALMKWVADKYPQLSESEQKRMVFAVAGAADKRGRTVKSPGWLDDAKRELEDMINQEISAAITVAINKKISISLK